MKTGACYALSLVQSHWLSFNAALELSYTTRGCVLAVLPVHTVGMEQQL